LRNSVDGFGVRRLALLVVFEAGSLAWNSKTKNVCLSIGIGASAGWVLLGLFFAVHSGLGVLVLMRIPTVPLSVYAVLTGPEYLLLAAYLGFFLDSDK